MALILPTLAQKSRDTIIGALQPEPVPKTYPRAALTLGVEVSWWLAIEE